MIRGPMSWMMLCLAAMSASAFGQRSISEQYLFSAANAERAARHLPPLAWNAALYAAAGNHAVEMAKRQSISHQYPGEAELAARGRMAGARFSTISENVAMAPTAVRIHDAWMNSEGHRANLLDPTVDAVGIRVLARNGELYAVEDFERSVENLSLDDQEQRVARLVRAASPLTVATGDDDARRTCERSNGYAGPREPWFVMRYTAADLTRLPAQLVTQLQRTRYHEAVVGACGANSEGQFSTFRIAVLLYP